MELWLDLLFGNWIGLLSMLVIFFMLGMVAFFVTFFVAKSKPTDSKTTAH
jgi:hypothetical protein